MNVSAATTIRVLLVDDHALVRDMLRERLQRELSMQVVATAASADEAVALVPELQPDVILMDIDMPGLICFEAARRILASHPQTRFIFLSAFCHDHYIAESVRFGAYGYLTKQEPPDRVVTAIRAAMRGEVTYSNAVRERLVIEPTGVRLATSCEPRLESLSAREVETLRYISRGLSMKEIAALMCVGRRTAEKHTENLMRKLAIHDRVELARFAIREGLAEA